MLDRMKEERMMGQHKIGAPFHRFFRHFNRTVERNEHTQNFIMIRLNQ